MKIERDKELMMPYDVHNPQIANSVNRSDINRKMYKLNFITFSTTSHSNNLVVNVKKDFYKEKKRMQIFVAAACCML